MDTNKWVSLARSKDKTRFNLCSVYRAATSIVATDGHRLHMSNGLPEVEPHFVDDIDGEFPDYTQVLPKTNVPSDCMLYFISQAVDGSKQQIKRLRKILAVVKAFERIPNVVLEVAASGATISHVGVDGFEIKYSLFIDAEVSRVPGSCDLPIRVGVNLAYFIDALGMTEDNAATLDIYGELGPMRFDNGTQTAIVMPARIP